MENEPIRLAPDWLNRNRQLALRLRRSHATGHGIGYATTEELKALYIEQGGRCTYCGAPGGLHLDHRVPISRGGTSWPHNLQWLCATHNTTKGNLTDSEYRESLDMAAGSPNPDEDDAKAALLRIGKPTKATGHTNGGRKPNADRLAAKESGAKRYRGQACWHGHNGERFTRNGLCCQCHLEYQRQQRAKKVRPDIQ